MLVAFEQVAAHERATTDPALDRAGAGVDAEAEAGFSPGVPHWLSAAALASLREALVRCDERPAALHLLAADALITAACEAAASAAAAGAHSSAGADPAGPELERQLAVLCEWYSPARLSALVTG
jgi:hypothetical protein